MKNRLYSVFDSKTATFGIPNFIPSDNAAIRTFSDAVNDGSNPNNQWHKHPEDFSLFFVGFFDDETGLLEKSIPSSLVTASALVAAQGSKEPITPMIQ